MKANDETRQYNEMAGNIENAEIYDGRGTYDQYSCNECGGSVITTYKDKGVTPFTMRCRKCGKGTMAHTRTFGKVPEGTPVLNWVRPSIDQFMKLSPGAKAHVLNGGLMLETDFK